MTLLEVKNISFSYQNKKIVDNASFSVNKGEIFCLAGPNGCGKTTILSLILGFNKPDTGEILLNGKSTHLYSEREFAGSVAYVPQNHVRSFPYKVEDVVMMGRTFANGLFKSPNKKDLEIVHNTMYILGIDKLSKEPYTNLSGGELQMVMLARALCQQSELIILDEPTAHLDFGRERHVLDCILDLVRNHNKSIIMSTHDLNQTLYFEDENVPVRMSLMNNGHIGKANIPTEIFTTDEIKNVYGLSAKLFELETDKKRHYMVSWR